MLKETESKTLKYLKNQIEILQEFDEYIYYPIKVDYDFRNDFKLCKILIDNCEKLNMNKVELLKEYNTYKNRIIEEHKDKIINVDCATNTAKYEITLIKKAVANILYGRTWINRRDTKIPRSTDTDFDNYDYMQKFTILCQINQTENLGASSFEEIQEMTQIFYNHHTSVKNAQEKWKTIIKTQ